MANTAWHYSSLRAGTPPEHVRTMYTNKIVTRYERRDALKSRCSFKSKLTSIDAHEFILGVASDTHFIIIITTMISKLILLHSNKFLIIIVLFFYYIRIFRDAVFEYSFASTIKLMLLHVIFSIGSYLRKYKFDSSNFTFTCIQIACFMGRSNEALNIRTILFNLINLYL